MLNTIINENPTERVTFEGRLKKENHKYILLEDSFKKMEQ